MRIHRWTLPTVAMLALGGCSTFYSTQTDENWDHVTFDETLPLALEDLFGTCADPIVLADDTTEIDLLGECPEASPSFDADGASLLHFGLTHGYTASSIDLEGSLFPDEIEPLLSDIFAIELQDDDVAELCEELCEEVCEDLVPGLAGGVCDECQSACEEENASAWPQNRCEFFIEFDLEFGELELANLDAEWVTRTDPDDAWDSWPALQIGYDFAPVYLSDTITVPEELDMVLGYSDEIVLARGTLDSEVTCDLAWSWWFLEALTLWTGDVEDLVENALLNRMPNGEHEIVLEGVDLQLAFDLSEDGTNVDAELGDVSVTATSLALQPALHEDLQAGFGSFEYLLADATANSTGGTTDMTADGLAATIEDGFRDALTAAAGADPSAADQIADGLVSMIEGTNEDGQTICSLHESGDELHMLLDPDGGNCFDFDLDGAIPMEDVPPIIELEPIVDEDDVQGVGDLTSHRALQAQRFAQVHADMVEAMLVLPPLPPIPGQPLPPLPNGDTAEAISAAWLSSDAYLDEVDAYTAGAITYVDFMERCTAATQAYVAVAR